MTSPTKPDRRPSHFADGGRNKREREKREREEREQNRESICRYRRSRLARPRRRPFSRRVLASRLLAGKQAEARLRRTAYTCREACTRVREAPGPIAFRRRLCATSKIERDDEMAGLCLSRTFIRGPRKFNDARVRYIGLEYQLAHT